MPRRWNYKVNIHQIFLPMLHRKWFFWLEKLRITPHERRAVVALLVLFFMLTGMKYLVKNVPKYDEEYYREIERFFRKKTREMKQRRAAVLSRYQPRKIPGTNIADTTARDTTGNPVVEKVNINEAGLQVLKTLPGIGPVYAKRIVEYRQNNGLFKETEDLLNIKGIGKKRLEKLEPFIKIN